jgi:hypothetical protein
MVTQRQVNKEVIDMIPCPRGTSTWKPIAHNKALDLAMDSINRNGLTVVNETHELTHNDERLFSKLIVEGPSIPSVPDFKFTVGVRNAHDKAFRFGVVVGTQVMVCSNLQFFGECDAGHKHTPSILQDVPERLNKAIGGFIDLTQGEVNRVNSLKTLEMTDTQANDIVIDMMDQKAIAPSKIPAVLEQWRTPNHTEFNDRNAWSLYNAFTEVFKGRRMDDRIGASQVLNTVFNGVIRSSL